MSAHRFAVVTVMTSLGVMHPVDDVLNRQHSVSVHRDIFDAELDAMDRNCEAEASNVNLYCPWLDEEWS